MRFLICSAGAIALAACSQGSDEPATPVAEPSPTPAASSADVDPRTINPDYTGPIPLPIRIGSDGPEMDACGTYAEVATYDVSSENIPYVHDAPSASTKARDKLNPGQGVQVCMAQNGFSGIVYPREGQEVADCGTGSPVATEQNYSGPCLAGWVDSRFLEMVAG
ncbi:MAG: hypothetical protein R3E14_14185 [Erythrobacter sp.]